VPTDEAKITIQIFEVEIWSDEVTGSETLDIDVALLEKEARPAGPGPCYVELTLKHQN
jgi:hypothetical protein